MSTYAERRKISQKDAFPDRGKFWRYCERTAATSLYRAAKRRVPHSIDAYDVDKLLVDQRWRCALSGVHLNPPITKTEHHLDPFGPSLDRIVPELGYVVGNLRVVCNAINVGINEWGIDVMLKIFEAVRLRRDNPDME